MIDGKKFTLDWLQFIEQVKDRVSAGDDRDFEYQLKSETRKGKRITFMIKVISEDLEESHDPIIIRFPKRGKVNDETA